jgi:hypothetical protein
MTQPKTVLTQHELETALETVLKNNAITSKIVETYEYNDYKHYNAICGDSNGVWMVKTKIVTKAALEIEEKIFTLERTSYCEYHKNRVASAEIERDWACDERVLGQWTSANQENFEFDVLDSRGIMEYKSVDRIIKNILDEKLDLLSVLVDVVDEVVGLGGNPEDEFIELHSSQQYPSVKFFGRWLAFAYSNRDNFSRSYDGSEDCWRELRLYALEDKFVLAIKYGAATENWDEPDFVHTWHVFESRAELKTFLEGSDDASGRDTYQPSKKNDYKSAGWLERELLIRAFSQSVYIERRSWLNR